MRTTVRQTPLWAMLWSIFSSSVNEQRNVKWMFSCSCSIPVRIAISSTIPENIVVSFLFSILFSGVLSAESSFYEKVFFDFSFVEYPCWDCFYFVLRNYMEDAVP